MNPMADGTVGLEVEGGAAEVACGQVGVGSVAQIALRKAERSPRGAGVAADIAETWRSVTWGAGAFEQPVISDVGPAQGRGVKGNDVRDSNGDADRLGDRGDSVMGGAASIEGGEASVDGGGGEKESSHDLDFPDGCGRSGP